MANFDLNRGAQPQTQARPSEHVRIGAVSLFALVASICLAVLAVLSLSTANASLTLSQRQATAMQEMYQAETAAQEFVAGLDALQGPQAANAALPALCASAAEAAGGQVQATATMEANAVHASFACENGRILEIEVTLREGGTLRIDKWKMTAIQNEEEPFGSLYETR